MSRPKTRRTTLYRLPDITPTQDGILDDFTNAVKDLDECRAEPRPIEVASQPVVCIGRQSDISKAEPRQPVTASVECMSCAPQVARTGHGVMETCNQR